MTDREILARWEELLAAAEGLEIGSPEYERREQAAYEFATMTPRHTRLIASACFRRLVGWSASSTALKGANDVS